MDLPYESAHRKAKQLCEVNAFSRPAVSYKLCEAERSQIAPTDVYKVFGGPKTSTVLSMGQSMLTATHNNMRAHTLNTS